MLADFYTLLEQKTPTALKRAIPQSWRIWLGYQVKGANLPPPLPPLDNAEFLRPLALPPGESATSIYDYLAGFHLEDAGAAVQHTSYLQHAFRRFLYTLEIVPPGDGRLLEIGANPYFISLLLRRFTRYDLTFTNYVGPGGPHEIEQVMVNRTGERIPFCSVNYNLETEPLPFAAESFDVLLLCEVLEHLTNDPYTALLHLKAGLKPGGYLVLTTPNVIRWQAMARFLAAQNIFDDYSFYGPYGRHNREYMPDEVQRLLEHLGFEVEELFTSDVTPEDMTQVGPFLGAVANRRAWLGEYTFVRARNVAPANPKLPAWLYRSYPPDQVA